MRSDESGESIRGLRVRLAFGKNGLREALADDAMRVGEHLTGFGKGQGTKPLQSVIRRQRAIADLGQEVTKFRFVHRECVA